MMAAQSAGQNDMALLGGLDLTAPAANAHASSAATFGDSGSFGSGSPFEPAEARPAESALSSDPWALINQSNVVDVSSRIDLTCAHLSCTHLSCAHLSCTHLSCTHLSPLTASHR